MKKSIADLVSEIKQIHEQYLVEVGAGGHKVWPRSIKDRVFDLVANVGSVKKASAMCSISAQTIYQWRSDQKKSNFKSLTVVNDRSKSSMVTVPNTKTSVLKSKDQAQAITVTTPKGYVIKGLLPRDVIEILLKLGVR